MGGELFSIYWTGGMLKDLWVYLKRTTAYPLPIDLHISCAKYCPPKTSWKSYPFTEPTQNPGAGDLCHVQAQMRPLILGGSMWSIGEAYLSQKTIPLTTGYRQGFGCKLASVLILAPSSPSEEYYMILWAQWATETTFVRNSIHAGSHWSGTYCMPVYQAL